MKAVKKGSGRREGDEVCRVMVATLRFGCCECWDADAWDFDADFVDFFRSASAHDGGADGEDGLAYRPDVWAAAGWVELDQWAEAGLCGLAIWEDGQGRDQS